jgi:hypothetical protein
MQGLLPGPLLGDDGGRRGRKHIKDGDGHKGAGIHTSTKREKTEAKSPSQTESQQEELENFSGSHRVGSDRNNFRGQD